MPEKTCYKCKISKTIDQFYKSKTGRYGVTGICKICSKKKVRSWYSENREHAISYQTKYYNSHKEEKKEYDRKYRNTNIEKIIARGKAWINNNPEKRKEIQKRYREKNSEKISFYAIKNRIENRDYLLLQEQEYRNKNRETLRKRTREWKRKNRHKVIVDKENRRAFKSNAEGTFTAKNISDIYAIQDGICVYHNINPNCLCNLSSKYHIDHIVPISRKGTNYPENLQLLCHVCNESKGAKTDKEFRKWINIVYKK